jgi:hypothetical protein
MTLANLNSEYVATVRYSNQLDVFWFDVDNTGSQPTVAWTEGRAVHYHEVDIVTGDLAANVAEKLLVVMDTVHFHTVSRDGAVVTRTARLAPITSTYHYDEDLDSSTNIDAADMALVQTTAGVFDAGGIQASVQTAGTASVAELTSITVNSTDNDHLYIDLYIPSGDFLRLWIDNNDEHTDAPSAGASLALIEVVAASSATTDGAAALATTINSLPWFDAWLAGSKEEWINYLATRTRAPRLIAGETFIDDYGGTSATLLDSALAVTDVADMVNRQVPAGSA